MSDDNEHRDDDDTNNNNVVILYPPGGAFNNLRRQQTFLKRLIEENWEAYSKVAQHDKLDYFGEHILGRIHASGCVLKQFKGKNPSRGKLVAPKDGEAFKTITQKLRDVKKREIARSARAITASKRKYNSTRMAPMAAFTPAEDVEGANDTLQPRFWAELLRHR